MATRIAPKAGYDTDIKAQYREQVWDAFAPGVADIIADTTGTLKAVIMPSAEGLEIEVALARGLRQEQIVCVDRSAAVIATSKWRKRWPDVKFFADEMATVGVRIARAGWAVRVANLDLCGNFSDSTVDAVRGFLRRAPSAPIFTLAITIAKGREGSALTSLLKAKGFSGDVEDARLGALFHMAGLETTEKLEVSTITEGSYISGRQPMAWGVVGLKNLAHFEEVARVEREQQLAPLRELIETWASEFEITTEHYARSSESFITKHPKMSRYIELETLMRDLRVTDRERDDLLKFRPLSLESDARLKYAGDISSGWADEVEPKYYLHSFWHIADCAASHALERRITPKEYYRKMLKKGFCRPAATKALLNMHKEGRLSRGWGFESGWGSDEEKYLLVNNYLLEDDHHKGPLSARRSS